jgi:hypothetical protein
MILVIAQNSGHTKTFEFLKKEGPRFFRVDYSEALQYANPSCQNYSNLDSFIVNDSTYHLKFKLEFIV